MVTKSCSLTSSFTRLEEDNDWKASQMTKYAQRLLENLCVHERANQISPPILGELVCKGNDVGCPSAPVTHHNWDWRFISQTLQCDGNHVGAAFHDQTHEWHTLAQTWITPKTSPFFFLQSFWKDQITENEMQGQAHC